MWWDDKTIYAGAKIDGSSAKLESIDLKKLDTVIGDYVKTGRVSIDFSRSTGGKNITSIQIPANAVRDIAEAVSDPNNDAQALQVVLSSSRSIEFDGEALVEKVRQAGGEDISISIEHADDVKTLSAAQKTAIGSRDAYEINVLSGGRHISDMGGKINVSVPYQLLPGEKSDGLRVYYVDDNGNRELCDSSYSTQLQRISFSTDHLSLYMIDYEAPAPAATEPPVEDEAKPQPVSTPAPVTESAESEESGFSGLFLWLVLLLIGVVGLCFAIWLLLRRKIK